MSVAAAPSLVTFLFAKESARVERGLKDNRGAIMVLGIFMACVMIGFMWMLVGLGDAMIWRDRSQEAADAVTYTSAAVDARGMNFIAFLNILMLLIAALYVAMALIYNLLDFALVLFGRNDDGSGPLDISSCSGRNDEKDFAAIFLDETGIGEVLQSIDFCDVAAVAQPLHDKFGSFLQKYEQNVMWKALPALSKAESFVAEAAPWAGAAVGSLIGYRYEDWGKHRYGMALSSSMIPAKIFPAPVKEWDAKDRTKPYTGRDARLGLPVETLEMGELCKVAANVILDGTMGWLKKIPVLGTIVGYLMSGLADSIEKDYCKKDSKGLFGSFDGGVAFLGHLASGFGWFFGQGPDPNHDLYKVKKSGSGQSIWEDPDGVGGPKEVVEYAENGNDWMQVWGMVYGGNRPEQAQRKVGAVYAPALNSAAPSDATPQGFLASLTTNFSVYFAQAEFYYDCESTWESDECNADGAAMYHMNWRARMRRMHGLSWGKDLLGWFGNTSLGSNFDSFATDWLKGGEASQLQTMTQTIHGFIGNSVVDGAYKDVKSFAGSQVSGMLNPASALPNVIH